MKHAFWSFLLLLSIFGETALFTFGKNFAGSPMSPAIWLISGMATAVAGFFLIGFKSGVVDKPWKKTIGMGAFFSIWHFYSRNGLLCSFPDLHFCKIPD
jgi:hypothetical protein